MNQQYTPTRVWVYVWAQSLATVYFSSYFFPHVLHQLGGSADDYAFVILAVFGFSFMFTVCALQELTRYEGFHMLAPPKRERSKPSTQAYDLLSTSEWVRMYRYVSSRWQWPY